MGVGGGGGEVAATRGAFVREAAAVFCDGIVGGTGGMGRKHRTADVLPVFIFIVAGRKKVETGCECRNSVVSTGEKIEACTATAVLTYVVSIPAYEKFRLNLIGGATMIGCGVATTAACTLPVDGTLVAVAA